MFASICMCSILITDLVLLCAFSARSLCSRISDDTKELICVQAEYRLNIWSGLIVAGTFDGSHLLASQQLSISDWTTVCICCYVVAHLFELKRTYTSWFQDIIFIIFYHFRARARCVTVWGVNLPGYNYGTAKEASWNVFGRTFIGCWYKLCVQTSVIFALSSVSGNISPSVMALAIKCLILLL